MTNRLFPFIAFVFLVTGCAYYAYYAIPEFYSLTKDITPDLDYRGTILDDNGVKWAFFISEKYGFAEWWYSSMNAKGEWNRPVYTGLPFYIRFYDWWVNSPDRFIVKRSKRNTHREDVYYRDGLFSEADSIVVFLNTLTRDRDRDGLPDIVETVLWTDPDNSDTDGDGVPDGEDQQPHAARREELESHARLHRYVIENELEAFRTNQLVCVEQFDAKPMEYTREEGLVLSLSPDTLDAFVQRFGYGVPILAATVKDTLQKYKVSFEFFVAPDDAWGYEMLFDWNDNKGEWVQKRLYSEWYAE
jgi:hypothetical protein